jgi:hypothetical protein
VLSARSTGLYLYLLAARPQITAEGLSEAFSEGEKAIGTCLRELRDFGLIETKKVHINGRIMTISHVVEPEYWTAEMAVLLQHTPLYSLLRTNSLYSYKQERVADGVREQYIQVDLKTGGEMSFPEYDDSPVPYDPEDKKEFVYKNRERRQKAYDVFKAEEFSAKVKAKEETPPEHWNPEQAAADFVKRCNDLWHVKPWVMDRSRFRIALSKARKTYGTTGDLEVKMMDLYFSQIKDRTEINEPEHIWKRFITQFGNLQTEARRLMITPDDMVTETIKAEKSLEWLDNV